MATSSMLATPTVAVAPSNSYDFGSSHHLGPDDHNLNKPCYFQSTEFTILQIIIVRIIFEKTQIILEVHEMSEAYQYLKESQAGVSLVIYMYVCVYLSIAMLFIGTQSHHLIKNVFNKEKREKLIYIYISISLSVTRLCYCNTKCSKLLVR